MPIPDATPDPARGAWPPADWNPDRCLDWLAKAAPWPPADWTLDDCLGWLEDAAAASVTDDELADLFHPDLLEDALGKAFNPNQPRAANGRFVLAGGATGDARTTGQKHADEHGVTGAHRIVVKSKRVTKYAGHDTVESYVGGHAKGRAHALRQLAADHKAGRIAFEAPEAKASGEAAATSKPPAGAKAASAAPRPVDASSWKKVGGKLGSNEGGTHEAPDGGKFYVKQGKSQAHVENELLANDLYAKLGAKTLGPKAFTLGGKAAIGSEIQSFGAFDPKNPAHLAAAQKHFAAHAFLANHDAVGLTFDNVGIKGGEAVMLDGGGALKYRAQGALKAKFGGQVDELNTLRDASIAPQAAAVFGKMTPAEIKASAAPVLKLSDADIDAAVAKRITDPKAAAEYASTLKARRDDIAKRVAALKVAPVAEAPPATAGAAAKTYTIAGKAVPATHQVHPPTAGGALPHKVAAAGVKPGDTIEQATGKMVANGGSLGEQHAADYLSLKVGEGKLKVQSPAEAKADEDAAAAKALKPPSGWKDDPARWANATVTPLDTKGGTPSGVDLANLSTTRSALGVEYHGSSITGSASDEQQANAVSFYAGSGYSDINGPLRRGEALSAVAAKRSGTLDAVVANSISKKDVILYRGIGGFGSGEANLNNLPPPTVFSDKGFVSTSFNPAKSSTFAGVTGAGNLGAGTQAAPTLFRVRVPKGSRIANIGRNKRADEGLADEAECLLPRGSKFVYVGHEVIAGRKIITVEHIPA